MMYEEAFLQEILENREDDTPRHIYADWLIDHGDEVTAARGEFIHIQCNLAKAKTLAERTALQKRERELLAAHSRDWGRLLSQIGCTCWEYRRGFVEGIGLPASALLAHADTLFPSTPIRTLKLYRSSGLWSRLASCPFLSRIISLDLEQNALGDADLEALAGSTQLTAMTTLHLWSNRIGDEGLLALLRSQFPRLTRIDLSSNLIADSGALALADSLFLSRLMLLDLTGNQITDVGASNLVNSPYLASQGWMDLSKNPISVPMQNVLRERFANRSPGAV